MIGTLVNEPERKCKALDGPDIYRRLTSGETVSEPGTP
jgi:hypothetical protein